MLLDLNKTTESSRPRDLHVFDDVLYFRAGDGLHGHELWRTDGTEAGTWMVKDVHPSNAGLISRSTYEMVHTNDLLFFVENDGVHGAQLWKSDGTTAGTSMIKDLTPFGASASPDNLTVLGDDVFFTASTYDNRWELWVTDGTAAGTVQLKTGDGFGTTRMAVWGSHLYFEYDYGDGSEVWRTDGTTIGTEMADHVIPAALDGIRVNGTLYFAHYDAVHGGGLWSGDGTYAGSKLLLGIGPGAGKLEHLVDVGGTLFFAADDGVHGDELWKSDGTVAGTVLVEDAIPGAAGLYPQALAVLGDRLYFRSGGLWPSFAGQGDLWTSDGTAAGTYLVKDLEVNSEVHMVNAAGTLFFNDDTSLWASDGTAAGTRMVGNWGPEAYTGPINITSMGAEVFFSLGNNHLVKGTGIELWKSDGRSEGTTLVRDINPITASSFTSLFTQMNGVTYFIAEDGVSAQHGLPSFSNLDGVPQYELYRTDGTPEGTYLVKDISPGSGGSNPSELFVHNDRLYFVVGGELWVSDGTANGTMTLRENLSAEGSGGKYFTVFKGEVYFVGLEAVTGEELWKTDGTAAGTRLVKDVRLGGLGSSIKYLTVAGDNLFFIADDGSGLELWKSDGSTAGTGLVANLNGSTGAFLSSSIITYPFAAVGSTLYFTPESSSDGRELWKTDGTEGGTVLVKNIAQLGSSNPTDLTAVGSTLYFTADDKINGRELWKSDGTGAGTLLVRDLRVGSGSSFFLQNDFPSSWNKNFTEFNGALYFVGSDGEPGTDLWTTGPELWKTDGTASGTVLVKDIGFRANGSYPDDLTVVSGKLYFSASGSNGSKLWESDGTEAGTREVADIVPGAGGSFPTNITAINGVLYFSAGTFPTGHEPWKYSIVPSVTDVIDVSPKTRTTPVSDVELVFSELIDLSSFTFADLTLTHNGDVIQLDGSVTLSAVSSLRYRIEGLASFTGEAGEYTLRVGAGQVTNLAGQSGLGQASTSWLNTSQSISVTAVLMEGQVAKASGVITNPPEAPFAVSLNWGDGQTETIALPAGAKWFKATHTYSDDSQSASGSSFDVTATLDYRSTGARLDLLAQFGGTGSDTFNDVLFDELGNSYAVGSKARFLSQLDSVGNLLWTKQLGGSGTASATAIARDALGNLLVTGSLNGTVDFDPGPGTFNLASGFLSTDVFVAKYSTTGELIWANRILGPGGSRVHFGTDLTVDSAGNVYVTGLFETVTLDFDWGAGTSNQTSAGARDGFVLKLNSLGNFVWARRFGGTGDDRGESIAVDSGGNIYVGGSFSGVADFGLGGTAYTLVSAGGTDAFLFKLTPSGDFAWAHRMGGSRPDTIHSVLLGAGDTIIAGGTFSGLVDFDPGDAVATLSGSIVPNVFLAKYGGNGGLMWARSFSGRDSGSSNLESLATDGQGNLYALGSFSGTFDFDPGSETAYVSGGGVFLAKLDVDGAYEWARAFGAGALPSGFGVAGDKITVVGNFQNAADFNPERGIANLTSAGSNDIFYARFSEAELFATLPIVVQNAAPVVHAGASVSLIRGQNLAIGGHFVDPSTADTFVGTVNYGDGTGDQPLALTAFRSFSLIHAYATPGTYSVVVTVVDDDGGVGQRTVVVSVGPRVTGLSVIDPDLRRTPLEWLDVTFSEPINLATFSAADATLRRNLQAIALNSSVTVSHLSGNTYRIAGLQSFTTAEGDYQLSVSGAGILTPDGFTVLDSVAAEWRMDTTPPVVTGLSGIAPGARNTPVSTAEVAFSERLELASLTYGDLALTLNGVAVSLTPAVTVTQLSGNRYQINGLANFTSLEGDYQLSVVGSGGFDAAGNPGSGSASAAWTMDMTRPIIVAVAELLPNPRNTPVSSIDVEMSERLDLSTFTYLDLSLTRGGVAVVLGSDVTVEHLGGSSYRINGLSPFTAAGGGYQFVIRGSDVHDPAGNAATGSTGVSWTTDTSPPAILDLIDITPELRNSPVPSVDVVFSEAIDLATFTFSDLSLTRDGLPVALSGAVTITLLSGGTYRISGLAGFTGAEGSYELTISGSGISDLAGNAGTGSGSDQWSVDATAPVVLDLVDIAPDPRATSVSTVDVVFNSAVNLATFTFADLALSRGGAPVSLTSGVTVALLSGSTYRISGLAAFTSSAGAYLLTVNGAGIQDMAGNLVNGTVSDSWTLDTTGPIVSDVIDVTPDPRRNAIATIDVIFSEAISLATFAFADMALTRNAVAVPLDGSISIEHFAGTTYRINGLEAFTGNDGAYQLRVNAAGIQDLAGNAGTGFATDSWSTDSTPPVLIDLVDIAPDPRNTAVTIATVIFSEPIDISTFTFADLIFTKGGTPLALTSSVTIAHLSGNSYRISGLDSFNGVEGQYELTVNGGGITDLAGNAGQGLISDSWSIDKTKPSVLDVLDVSPSPRTSPIDSVDVTFSEELNPTSFTHHDVALTRNGAAISLNSALTVTHLAGTAYRIGGLNTFTGTSGDYVLTVNGAGLVDVAGNFGLGSASMSWKMDINGPVVIDVVDVLPDPRSAPVASLDLTFNEPIQLETFTWADISLTMDGSLIALTSSLAVSHVSGSTYRIAGLEAFTAAEGIYQLTVSAVGIEDIAGNGGSGSVSDNWTIDTSPALLLDVVDIQPDPRTSSITTSDVTFSESINLSSFTSADLSLTRNGAAIGLTPSVTIALVSGSTYRISGLSSYTATDGTYDLSVHGLGILDLSGNTVLGIVSDTWVKDATGPVLTDLVDVSPDPRNSPVSTVDVIFSEPIDLTTFTFADLTLDRGLGSITLSSAITISYVSGNTYRISGLEAFTANPGIYTLRVLSSGIRDQGGNVGTGSASDVWSVDTTPPVLNSLTDVVPEVRSAIVASIDVAFSEVIDLTTFTLDDIELNFNGATAPLASPVVISYVSGTTYRIANLDAFASADGDYQITVRGSGIQDRAGNFGSVSRSETWTLDATPPSAQLQEVSPNPRRTSISSIDVTFSEPINVATFTRSDLQLLRDGAALSLSSVVTITNVSGNTYRINGLGSYTGTPAEYQLSVNMSGISDAAGNIGEAAAITSWTLDTSSPVLLDVLDIAPNSRNTGLVTVDVVFSELINPASLTAADLALKRDGTSVTLSSAVTVSHLSGSTYRILGLESFTSLEGNYQLTVSGAGVMDLADNLGSGTQSASWTVDSTRPVIERLLGIESPVRNTSVATVDVVFSGAIDPATFTVGDIGLQRDGLPLAVGSRVTVALLSGDTYRISGLEAFTSVEGSYRLTVDGLGVLDAAGNIGVGAVTGTWTLDSTAPLALDLLGVVPKLRNTAVNSVDVQFSELISLASFTSPDLVLLRDNAPVVLPVGLTITHLSGFSYRIAGLENSGFADGEYELRIHGAGILDPAGNPGTGSVSTTWTIDATPPESPVIAGVTPDTAADGDGYTSSSSISINGRAEPGATVHLYEEQDLLVATTLAHSDGTWTVDLSSQPLPEGSATFIAVAVDATGNRSENSVELIVTVDLTSPVAALGFAAVDELYNHPTAITLGASEPFSGVVLDQFRLTHGGREISLASAQLIRSESHFTLSIGGLAREAGNYELEWLPLSSTVTDRAGHAIGSVESLAWTHVPRNPWHNLSEPPNVNGREGVIPLDALIVINELNLRQYSDPTSGMLGIVSSSTPYFLDVSNDGYVTAIDALIVINHLNNTVAAGEGEHSLDSELQLPATNAFEEITLSSGDTEAQTAERDGWLSLIASDVAEQARQKREAMVVRLLNLRSGLVPQTQ